MSRRHPKPTQPCHTPTKRQYLNRAIAESVARHDRAVFGPPVGTYRCACGYWHVTSHPRQEQPA